MKSAANPYLLVTELEGTGYIIGYFPSVKAAEKVANGLVDKYQYSYLKGEEELYERLMNYQTYKIHPSCKHSLYSCKQSTTNGIYFAHIIDMEREGFTVKKFLFERSNTIFAFDIENYNPDENFFADFFIDLIAN